MALRLFFHIYKLCILRQPHQVDRSDRAISLFGYDNLRNILIHQASDPYYNAEP